jgi:hypothetical protein
MPADAPTTTRLEDLVRDADADVCHLFKGSNVTGCGIHYSELSRNPFAHPHGAAGDPFAPVCPYCGLPTCPRCLARARR